MKKKRRVNKDPKKVHDQAANNFMKAMQLPSAILFNTAHFEINGNREVIVDGCKGILEYDENVIKLNTGKMITEFFGRKLTIKCLKPDSLIIEGFITSVQFTM